MATEQGTIAGYRLLTLMMTGQTSQVWEVSEPGSGRHFALKLLLPENVRNEQHRKFLFHEAEVGMSLHHKNIIRVLKVSRDKHTPFMLMEFFPGGNVKRRLQQKHEIVREKAHSLLCQAASGLAALNDKGWVHRDVKPDNILLNSAGEVRIIDFALAKRISRGGGGLFGLFKKRGTTTSGTRSYMSPEQIRNEGLDERADVYSFGATAYEITTGRPPFRANTPNELLNKHLKEKPASPQLYEKELTDEFSRLVLRMLEKDKKARPKDFHEVLAQLRGLRVFKGDKLETPGER